MRRSQVVQSLAAVLVFSVSSVFSGQAWAQPSVIGSAGTAGTASTSVGVAAAATPTSAPATTSAANPTPGMLAPTNHPRLSTDPSHLWLAPDQKSARPATALASGLGMFRRSQYSDALAALSQSSVQEGVLGHYALYYAARAQQELGRHTDALRTYRLLQQRQIVGYLREAAAIGEGEMLEATGDHAAAAAVYERLSKEKPVSLDDILLRLGRESEASGQTEKAVEAYLRIYYEFPLGEYSGSAKARLDTYPAFGRPVAGSERFRLELGRAQRLFGAKQYGPAKAAFEILRSSASGDDEELVELRIAECDFYLKRYRPALTAVQPYAKKGSRQGEALYFEAVASRALGDNATYLRNVRTIVDKFGEQSWAEEALNNLAVQYIRQDDDEAADTVFRELISRYPRGATSERAVWKVGWRSYRAGRYDEAAQLFERAAADFPRSDYRPAWLFWAGRAHDELKKPELAQARYTLAALDYLNTYYGRLAVQRLNGRVPAPRVIADVAAPVSPLPPNDAVVRALLEVELYDDALNELKYIERSWGPSPAAQATTAWIYRQQGLVAKGGWEQFNLLRGSISMMRRAYPQFMASGGEYLPKEVLSLIFPLSYWDLIQKHAAANGLDPYFVAALMAQESTFVADIRSSANAVGLMQLIPSTARMYARKLGLPYSPKLMTNPEANIRMGTAYLADKVREFGDLHLVLAAYNAGERAVRKWQAEHPGVPVDEFIDDIPYPETQNYVKRILGTADDYRRLYGGTTVPPLSTRTSSLTDAAMAPMPVYAGEDAAARLVQAQAVSEVTASTPVKPEVKKPAPKTAKKSKTTRTTATRTRKPAAKKTRAVKPASTSNSVRPAARSAVTQAPLKPVRKRPARG